MRRVWIMAALSLMSDLGMGRPMERVLRQTVIAMRLAEAADVDPTVAAATYYTSLLTWVGCATDTSELAKVFRDHQFVAVHVSEWPIPLEPAKPLQMRNLFVVDKDGKEAFEELMRWIDSLDRI